VSDVLDRLCEAPVPDGLVRRAADRWQHEAPEARQRRRSLIERLRVPAPAGALSSLKPALVGALALALLVVAVRNRVGVQAPGVRDMEAPTLQRRPTRSASRPAATHESALDDKRAAPIAGGGRSRAEEREATGSETLADALRTRIARKVGMPDAARILADAVKADPSRPDGTGKRLAQETGEALAMPTPPGVAGVPMVVGSAADLAYLNAEESVEEPRPGGVGVADPRLLKLVTLDEEGEGIPDLLGALRSRTGVQIGVPDGIARQSLAVVCRDRPLRDVMRQMTRVLGVRWGRVGAGETSRYEARWRPRDMATAFDVGRTSQASAALGRGAPAPAAPHDAALRASVDVMGPPDMVRAALRGQVAESMLMRVEGWLMVGGGAAP
jgi:hypothetical protein